VDRLACVQRGDDPHAAVAGGGVSLILSHLKYESLKERDVRRVTR
jgi:hypothetical protein